MKEDRDLLRGWARGNLTRLPRPVTSWSATALAWTGLFLKSPHPYPTIWRLRVARSSVGSRVARRLPDRHSSVTASPLRCKTGLSVGRRGSGRPPPWCPQGWSFARRHMLDTLADWWGLQRHCGGIGGPVGASAQLSLVLVGAGVTPAVHSHRPAPLAPVVAGDRKGAHGRVNSDRAVDRPCSRLIRPQGPHRRTAAWRACPCKSHAVGCCWFSDTQWTARSTAGRFRRLGGSVKATPAGKYVPNARQSKRAAHTLPPGQSVCCCTVHTLANTAPFGPWCRPPSPFPTLLAYVTGL